MRKILLADDSVTAQNMGRRILADAGYEVTTVNNGSAALKKIAEAKPDLIVLDVYMPGYGGLEVCQRLRESDDTARIPVLLTVGKLEPFKVDEVRRVRADAFIVKPFEASELLTALTKLEDKIVPVSKPRKASRFPKPGDTLDDFVGTGKQYGDTETGWKNRLHIPPPHPKAQPEFPEPEPSRTRDTWQSQEQNWERTRSKLQEKEAGAAQAPGSVAAPTPANLPADITPDEIAAIQAAAATLNTSQDAAAVPAAETQASPQQTVKEVPAVESSAAALTSAATTEVHAEVSPLPQAAPYASAEPAASVEPPQTQIAHPVDSYAAVEAATETPTAASPATEAATPNQNKLAEHEVAAVLASLEFVTATDGAGAEADEPLFATIAATPRQEHSGPRWIAVPVPLTEEESSLILEQEMQKAMAAMAATECREAAARTENAVSSEPASIEPSATLTSADSENAQPEAQPPPSEAAASDSEGQSIAQAASEAATTESPAAEFPAPPPQAAYAAAASAGPATSDPNVSVDAVSQTPTGEAQAPAAESAPLHGQSELAAAWASWKQVRDSVVGPLASQISTAATDASAESSSVETHSTLPSPEAEARSAEESDAIASIVDTVLAELKPKLMQEIARKMGQDKKQK